VYEDPSEEQQINDIRFAIDGYDTIR